MVVAAVLAITLDPALRLLLTNVKNFDFRPRWLCRVTNAVLVGKIRSEERHPISRVLMRLYEPVVRWSLRRKWVLRIRHLTPALSPIEAERVSFTTRWK